MGMEEFTWKEKKEEKFNIDLIIEMTICNTCIVVSLFITFDINNAIYIYIYIYIKIKKIKKI